MSKQEEDMSVHSETHFYDPAEYVRTLYNGSYPSQLERELIEWIKDKIHTAFAGGNYTGEHLLDIGSGPVIYPVITASEWFDGIYLSDLSKANVEFLQKWIRGESEPMEYLMKESALKDGKGFTWEQKNSQVRRKVKDAVVWDMSRPECLLGTALDGVRFDVVTACLCMCAASSTIEEYTRAIKNIRELLKPGGHFVIGDVMNQTWYTVGDVRFGVLPTTEQEIKTAFSECGYEIEHFETTKLGVYQEVANCDAKSAYFIIGKKL